MRAFLFDSIGESEDIYFINDFKFIYHDSRNLFIEKSVELINSFIKTRHKEEFNISINTSKYELSNINNLISFIDDCEKQLGQNFQFHDLKFKVNDFSDIHCYSKTWDNQSYSFKDNEKFYFLYFETQA